MRATERRHASGWLGRYIGLLIAGIAVGTALVLWFAVSLRSLSADQSPQSTTMFGLGRVFYDTQAPALTLVIGAVGLGLILAAGVAVAERVVMDRSRRSTDARVKLLAPKVVMAETRGVFGGPKRKLGSCRPRRATPAWDRRGRAARARRVQVVTGIMLLAGVLPQSIMDTPWFAALSMFVAINTVLYLTLAIIKLLPKAYVSDWVDQHNRRSETRSIYPEAESTAHRHRG